MDNKEFRKEALSSLSNEIGVYALCDLDRVPIYIGQSKDGIRTRVQRHITSARSDVIANRQLDVWEIFEVWAWPVPDGCREHISDLEEHLIYMYNEQSPLVNGKLPPARKDFPYIPDKQVVPIMSEDERIHRLDPARRLPRQLEHLSNLFSHILEVKNNSEQRRMLRVHFNRTQKYYQNFMLSSGESEI